MVAHLSNLSVEEKTEVEPDPQRWTGGPLRRSFQSVLHLFFDFLLNTAGARVWQGAEEVYDRNVSKIIISHCSGTEGNSSVVPD